MYISPFEPFIEDGVNYFTDSYYTSLYGKTAGLNENVLKQIRCGCRNIALCNEFAINALENRINYVIGQGHNYRIIAKQSSDAELAKRAQDILENFLEHNDWNRRQQEIMRRNDRDGETFLRLFPSRKSVLQIRFIEPEQIYTPLQLSNDQSASHGIQTERNDAENVLGYWVDDEFIDAEEILHRKCNVDGNVKRGIPLLFPVCKNLQRAEKLLRNMSIVAEIQSAVALIRKHRSTNADAVRQFVNRQSVYAAPENSNEPNILNRFVPGTIIDAANGTEYDFPIAAVDAGRYILVLQAELRAVASRLVMPEFMLTSDASNANYSSSMIAEGPAVRMFERIQHQFISDDKKLFRKMFETAVHFGLLPNDVMQRISLHCIPPTLAVRDRYQEAKADEILFNLGILSKETLAMRYGLDPQNEACLCRES